MRPILEAVETAYAFGDDDEDTWLDRVLHAMRAAFEGDRGVCALRYRLGLEGPHIGLPHVVGVGSAQREAIAQLFESAIARIDPNVIRSVFRGPRRPLQSSSELLGEGVVERMFFAEGPLALVLDAGDFVGGRIQKSDTEGFIVGSLLPAPTTLSRATRTEITRLYAHLESASRLRAARSPVATIARGEVTNVTNDEVREALGKLKKAHPGMLAARAGTSDLGPWSTRVDARYSLVATKRDGEAEVLENAVTTRGLHEEHPRVRAVAKLLGEGHPQKLIAYELGIPAGSVYRYVARLKELLGEPTTVGLVGRLAALDEGPSARPAPREAVLASLSPAERFVVEAALRGLAAGAIANARGGSVRTAENMLRAAYRKLGVGSRKELAAKVGFAVVAEARTSE